MHIKECKAVTCPFRQVQVLSTFTSHMSRKHRNSSEGGLVDSVSGASVVQPNIPHESNERHQQSDTDFTAPDDVNDEQSEVF